ncbi:MAG: YhjD/YihY/BrkB family envelope integrity protein [Acidimicrobiales bacterium]|nr:YhjD/YihY/BrkB family envelope integrity protein [Acidimicrobiales bacterium]
MLDLNKWRARLPWLDAVLRVTDRFGAIGGGPLSSSIALASFLSLFPLLLVAIATLGFVSAGDDEFALQTISDLGLEGRSAQVVTDAIGAAEDSRQAASLLGLGGLLWSGLGVVGALQAAVNAAWQQTGRGLMDKLVAARWLAGAVVLFVASAGLGGVLGFLPGWATPLALLLGVGLNVLLFLWTYHGLGNVHAGWQAHLPGAVLVGIGVEILKVVGSIYVPRAVASSSGLYGSIGVVFAVLAWLALYARLIVYGAVVNVLRWERTRGTDTIEIEVPHQEGATPLAANRGGAIHESAT